MTSQNIKNDHSLQKNLNILNNPKMTNMFKNLKNNENPIKSLKIVKRDLKPSKRPIFQECKSINNKIYPRTTNYLNEKFVHTIN